MTATSGLRGFLWQQGARKNGPYVNKNEYGIELMYDAGNAHHDAFSPTFSS